MKFSRDLINNLLLFYARMLIYVFPTNVYFRRSSLTDNPQNKLPFYLVPRPSRVLGTKRTHSKMDSESSIKSRTASLTGVFTIYMIRQRNEQTGHPPRVQCE